MRYNIGGTETISSVQLVLLMVLGCSHSNNRLVSVLLMDTSVALMSGDRHDSV